jgi:hypothetical protein
MKRLIKWICPEKKEQPIIKHFRHGKTLYKAKFSEALKVWFVYDYDGNFIQPNTETYSYFVAVKLMGLKK